MKHILMILLIAFFQSAFAQYEQGFYPTGSVATISGQLDETMQVHSVIGELFVGDIGNEEIIINQGFVNQEVLKIEEINAIASESNEIEVNVFPNPTSSILNIKIGEISPMSEIHAEIVDMYGRVVFVVAPGEQLSSFTTYEVNLSDLASGHYIIRIRDDLENYYADYKIVKI